MNRTYCVKLLYTVCLWVIWHVCLSCQVISHYQCKEQRDAHRFEKISNIIKQFKLSCRSVRLHSCSCKCWTQRHGNFDLSYCPTASWRPLSKAWKCATLTLLPLLTCSLPTLTSWWSCQTRLYVSISMQEWQWFLPPNNLTLHSTVVLYVGENVYFWQMLSKFLRVGNINHMFIKWV